MKPHCPRVLTTPTGLYVGVDTGLIGDNTGRPRWQVWCIGCGEMLHEATTSIDAQALRHDCPARPVEPWTREIGRDYWHRQRSGERSRCGLDWLGSGTIEGEPEQGWTCKGCERD